MVNEEKEEFAFLNGFLLRLDCERLTRKRFREHGENRHHTVQYDIVLKLALQTCQHVSRQVLHASVVENIELKFWQSQSPAR